MRKTETIKLGNKYENPPAYYAKQQHRPTCKQFDFIPKGFKQINQYVKDLEWNCAKKSLEVVIGETAQFDVFNWINYLSNQHKELEKSPFADLEKSSITVAFKDTEGQHTAIAMFKDLTVVDHMCDMSKRDDSAYGIHLDEHLAHRIVLEYTKIEFKQIQRDSPEETMSREQLKDVEWQTIETP